MSNDTVPDDLDPIEHPRVRNREDKSGSMFKCGKRGPSVRLFGQKYTRVFCTKLRGHNGPHLDVEEAPDRPWGP